MNELEVYVDKDAWVYITLKKDGELIDIICLANHEEAKSNLKSTQLIKDLRTANKIFWRFYSDKVIVKSDYPPYSSESVRKFVTYRDRESLIDE